MHPRENSYRNISAGRDQAGLVRNGYGDQRFSMQSFSSVWILDLSLPLPFRLFILNRVGSLAHDVLSRIALFHFINRARTLCCVLSR